MADNRSTFTWLGHSFVRIDTARGKTLLIDPFVKNPKFPRGADDFGHVDQILVTHGHFDHLGQAVELAKQYDATIVASHELTQYAQHMGIKKVVGFNRGGTVDVDGIKHSLVPASHSGGIDAADGTVWGGEANGFVTLLEDGTKFYHSGDTTLFSDLRLIRELHEPRFGFLSIGGHYTMGPKDAARAVEWLGLTSVVPIHWGTFPVLTGTPAELRKHTKTANVLDVKVGEPHPLAATATTPAR